MCSVTVQQVIPHDNMKRWWGSEIIPFHTPTWLKLFFCVWEELGIWKQRERKPVQSEEAEASHTHQTPSPPANPVGTTGMSSVSLLKAVGFLHSATRVKSDCEWQGPQCHCQNLLERQCSHVTTGRGVFSWVLQNPEACREHNSTAQETICSKVLFIIWK